MNDNTLIRCNGCNAVTSPYQAACPACGRCLNCGQHLVKKFEPCSECEIPHCDCCGRCPGCGEVRAQDVPLCSCGHPHDPEKLEELIRYTRVHNPEPPPPLSMGCKLILLLVLVGIPALVLSIYFIVR